MSLSELREGTEGSYACLQPDGGWHINDSAACAPLSCRA
jgi:hypothetical protein